MFLWHVFRPVGDEFVETEKSFLFTIILSTKNVLKIYTTIADSDLQVAFRRLFFHVNGFQMKCFFICNQFGNKKNHCLYKMWRDTYVSGLGEVQEHLLVVPDAICKFSKSELNINAKSFEASMKRF
jgi:hypothetical protein